ncbi:MULTISPECIES: DNA repair protein RadC [unclassified Fibrobacter]|uniref:RadC family protein n=1 Tax=unclassified Fibrobacter TaxID=2634177 RepID=UPI000D6B0EA1|nr:MULTISPECIES: DNA repair protein RadC [unclassified Fibrobacter]PWJ62098.1 DNA repair protein RadC [Fibrobacter sp. UWR4]PZW67495.1 DNA repair protein RadC [Fibrobacter sp. UWR1]
MNGYVCDNPLKPVQNYLPVAHLLPREKMEQYGPAALSNEELLALILGSGCQNCDVFELSRSISEYLATETSVPTLENLRKIRGLGKVKALQILACLELSGRYILSEKAIPVGAPEDLISRLSYLKYETQEHLVLVTLNSANYVIRVHELTTGLVNQTPVHPREAFVKAIEDRAVSVIFAHNHPSGSLLPSPEDMSITRSLCLSGKILQIPVLDHIIVGKRGFTSICRTHPEIFEDSFQRNI